MKTSIYIHIPFCKSKCSYCDFISFTQNNYDKYTQKLIYEIKNCKELKNVTVKTIYIGGGTPSLFSCNLIEKILSQINFSDEIEITIEANPESINREKINFYKSIGINRISIGLQAIQDNLLKILGRAHNFQMFEKAYEIAAKTFDNINIDLMFGLPKQNLDDWSKTLEYVKKIKPQHISAYSLIIEPNTKFYTERKNLQLPDENTEREMYDMTKKILAPDYYQYEISNFTLQKKFECQHNKIYWTLENYLGFGVAAHSFFNGVRWNNTNDIQKYLTQNNFRENIIHSTPKSLMEEFMFLGLRMNCGVNKNIFRQKFGHNIKDIYGRQINLLKQKNLLTENENSLYLTDFGMNFANYAMSEFILD